MKEKLTATEAMRRYCPNAKTIEEMYKGDETAILITCLKYGMSRNELLISKEDVFNLIKHAPLKGKEKKNFKKNFIAKFGK